MILVVGASGQLGTLVVQKLTKQGRPVRALVRSGRGVDALTGAELVHGDLREPAGLDAALDGVEAVVATANRSEEHTSELQSQFHLVCRLLLEKKKKK